MALPEQRTIAAVLTAYHPDERLAAVVKSALESCALVVIADNTPSDTASSAAQLSGPRVKVIQSGRNLGLGGALNLAVSELPADTDAVLFLDQDSVLPAGLVEGLAADFTDEAIGVVAPTPWDFKHETYYCDTSTMTDTVSDVEAVITSGMMVRRAVLDRVKFREDLFIDWVDIAFCLDVGAAGFRIVQDWRQRLLHSIGNCEMHSFLFKQVHVSHYPVWRLYWIGRNVPIVHRIRFGGGPRAWVSTTLFIGPRLVSMLLYSDRRFAHAGALMRGLSDGFRGRVNPAYLPAGASYPGLESAPR
jgi:rhamnosyltransferase